MENNKHPHHDLIVELTGDLSKKAVMVTGSNSIVNVEIHNVASDIKGLCTFKIKPREFTKGHWYPCLRHELEFICKFNGHSFVLAGRSEYKENQITIGESLGEIKFGSGK